MNEFIGRGAQKSISLLLLHLSLFRAIIHRAAIFVYLSHYPITESGQFNL